MKFINQIERELRDNPFAALLIYALLFSVLWKYFEFAAMPFMLALVIYEVKKSLSEK